MITFAKTDLKDNSLKLYDEFVQGCWINLINPLDSEVEKVSAFSGIPEDMLKTALDEEESAHIDRESEFRLIIVDVPVIEDDNEGGYTYSTLPLAIITGRGNIVTICLKETPIINDFLESRVRNFATHNSIRFILQILYKNSVKFLSYLKHIDKTTHRIQRLLHKSMKNKEIFQLLEIEKSLVYFSTALKANQAVIEKISKFEELRDKKEELELLDDVMIENKQAIEMSDIYRDILSGTMDAFASIINNNVNIVMKLLTIITIILSVPTLIASLWGMNISLPLENNPLGFWIIIIASIIITVIVALILIKRSSRIK